LRGGSIQALDEVADAERQTAEKRESELRVLADRTQESITVEGEAYRLSRGDRRGRVVPTCEHRNVTERAAGAFHMDDMLAPSKTPHDAHGAFEDDVQVARVVAWEPQNLVRGIPTKLTASGQRSLRPNVEVAKQAHAFNQRFFHHELGSSSGAQ
jgi:hypothetical protein